MGLFYIPDEFEVDTPKEWIVPEGYNVCRVCFVTYSITQYGKTCPLGHEIPITADDIYLAGVNAVLDVLGILRISCEPNLDDKPVFEFDLKKIIDRYPEVKLKDLVMMSMCMGGILKTSVVSRELP
ncbi:MAG: hypothetical protein KAT46_05320 [Deltaproteobacteria bacterium]|nr:hypothetical protein [Deltaproteobacteria bacterium]